MDKHLRAVHGNIHLHHIGVLTGVKPKVRRIKDGRIIIECSRTHLDGFMRYAELAGAITRWLEETGR
jgi:hypothetical protein